MNVSPDVNYDELARSTDDFNAAQLKAVRGVGAGAGPWRQWANRRLFGSIIESFTAQSGF